MPPFLSRLGTFGRSSLYVRPLGTHYNPTSVAQQLIAQGYTANNSELLAELTGVSSLTDDFFANPDEFFLTHFPANVSHSHVLVLTNVDENAEHEVWEWAYDVHRLMVEKVDNDRGRGRMRGCFPDFVIGKDAVAVRAKANQIRQENGMAGGA